MIPILAFRKDGVSVSINYDDTAESVTVTIMLGPIPLFRKTFTLADAITAVETWAQGPEAKRLLFRAETDVHNWFDDLLLKIEGKNLLLKIEGKKPAPAPATIVPPPPAPIDPSGPMVPLP